METEQTNKGTYTEKRKQYLRKWRDNNREQFNEICKKAMAVYYLKNKEAKNKADRERYQRKKAEKLRLLEEKDKEEPINNLTNI